MTSRNDSPQDPPAQCGTSVATGDWTGAGYDAAMARVRQTMVVCFRCKNEDGSKGPGCSECAGGLRMQLYPAPNARSHAERMRPGPLLRVPAGRS